MHKVYGFGEPSTAGFAMRASLMILSTIVGVAAAFGGGTRSKPPAEPARLADLRRLAAKAAPEVAAFFRSLADPADQISLNDGKQLRVVPLPRYPRAKPAEDQPFEVRVLGENKAKTTIDPSEITSILPFEEFALIQAERLLGKSSDSKTAVSQEKLMAAEKGLAAVVRFHLSQRRRPLTGDDPGAGMKTRLEEKLLDVRLLHLNLLVKEAEEGGSWSPALSRAEQLLELYGRQSAVQAQVRKVWASQARKLVEEKDYLAAREQLTRIDEQFASSSEADPVRTALQERAASLLREAKALPEPAGSAKLRQALRLWPQLPGLRDALLKRQNEFSILYVGVKRLPVYLSPGTAWTDSEKQVVELLFESLVAPDDDLKAGQLSRAGLARIAPEILTSETRFHLPRDAYWSDGSRMTSADIRHTVEFLRQGSVGRQAGGDLLETPRLEENPFVVSFRLRQGLMNPLAPFTFKILPQVYRKKPLSRADDLDFAKDPSGTGPYQYLGRKEENGRSFSVFAANPHYVRAGDEAKPAIREIRFFAWSDATKNALPIPYLLLDLPTEKLGELKAAGVTSVQTQLPPRVFFLAANHRSRAMANVNLRRALTHAIDRDRLLTEFFRGGKTVPPLLEVTGAAPALAASARSAKGRADLHRPLNGPFPTQSWAFAPSDRVPADPFNVDLARTFARQAAKELGKAELSLLCPNDDARTVAACQALADQVDKLAAGVQAAIRIKVVPLAAREFRQAFLDRNYDLAYLHWDFPDATYRLQPLFDFVGYEPDAKLNALLGAASSHRHFLRVQEIAHEIHAHFYEQMPLIPLWQLHMHVAVHPALKTVNAEAPFFFRHVAHWKIEKK
jgi:ABC-type transport system substrate-binding protein